MLHTENELTFAELQEAEPDDFIQKIQKLSDLDDEQFSFLLDGIYLQAVEKVFQEVMNERQKNKH
jgi:hypothetical protein